MAAKRTGLGKGLNTLIPSSKLDTNTEGLQPDKIVNITEVEPNPNQPRKTFNEDRLQELADSIKQHGIIEPIIVVKRDKHYEIVSGERRWRAAMKAEQKTVPIIVRDFTEKEILEISIIENVQRDDLNPIEEALGYKRLLEEFSLTQDEVAERVSKSRTAVTNTMRLLKLCDNVQQMLIDEMISAGHARALLAIDNNDKQYELAQRIMDEKLSVRDIEKIIKDLNKPEKEKKKQKQELDYLYKDIEEKLKVSLGTKVQINAKSDKKGTIVIDYYSKEDFERLTEMFLS